MAANVLTNPGFEAGTTDWSSTQGTLSITTTTPHEGTQALRFTSSGTGNRNIPHVTFPCAPGDVFSVEAYTRRASGAARQISVMVQFLNASAVQTGNVIGTLVTPGTDWTLVSSLNATAPATTTQVRAQLRLNASDGTEVYDFDDLWMNLGATVVRDVPSPGGPGVTVWNGTAEVTGLVTVWNGAAEVAATASSIA